MVSEKIVKHTAVAAAAAFVVAAQLGGMVYSIFPFYFYILSENSCTWMLFAGQ